MNFLNNLHPVTKNLLLINVILFIITVFGEQQGFPITHYLGGHVFSSPFFQPYQLVTHFFMHGSLMHLVGNMFGLVFFGNLLERVWGPKRFFIFYFVTGIGAFVLYQGIGYYELLQVREEITLLGYNYHDVHHLLSEGKVYTNAGPKMTEYVQMLSVPMIGASGAVFGILAAAAYLFPNMEIMLIFFPVPIKAKYFVSIYLVYEVIQTIQYNPTDNIAHLAHIAGALIGFIMVKIWQKSRTNFY
ncbi:Membrane associated serine protease, rhomboid family [Lishizhenia tianjinensis]|uniref:Membrane associated serine protease, rhomboid family n=1 Tax=Lishizhenia tianjinensis TaxID=477690 RepID=A0A1I6YFI8_9FLAO|nr:rhomboid family intramembrane serine protease [Lishizhenia tianjinensis]SFT49305.1 Membrane associated serine protease, rhomboid family [Lishizhenia tianjinensis]